MPSKLKMDYISSDDLRMLNSVLASIGFNRFASKYDKRRYEAAALKLMNFFRKGMTSPTVLKAEMLFIFGMQKYPHT